MSKRIGRYLSTVGLTLLHGTEGILLTQRVVKEVQAFDRHCLREMLCMKKPGLMGWTEFRRRQHRILRRTFSGMRRLELTGQLLKKQHGWAGHVARMNPEHLAAQWARGTCLETWRMLQAVGQCLDSRSQRGTWRHTRAGPVRRWDTILNRSQGADWLEMAQDRDAWKLQCSDFVNRAATVLLGSGHRLFGT